ncbi:MAG: rhomboid family intramembrane serine protease [Actinobacteria bacterium]|nr:rhomboid family intramembrane serine protease [Actinomycetota bacterium]
MKRNATTGLITVISAFYLLQLLFPSLEFDLGLIKGPINGRGVAAGEWYRILTVGLIHGGLFHLGFNMYALLVLGNPLEELFGKVRFLAIFFFSLIAGSLTSLYLNPPYQLSVGVSGALFGLFGAFALVAKRIGADLKSIMVIIGINFAMAFILPGIDWHAHLGGLIGGVIATTAILRAKI